MTIKETAQENILENGAQEGTEQVSHEVTIFAEPIKHFENFTITNALFSSWVVVFIIIAISVILRSKLREIPKGIQNLFEIIVEGTVSICDQVTNNRKLSLKIFYYL